jgi:hypothetical protein
LSLAKQAPSYLAGLLKAAADCPNRSSLRSVSHGDLYVLATQLKLGERAFSVAGPCAFNRLPVELNKLEDTPTFKHELETFLFNQPISVS